MLNRLCQFVACVGYGVDRLMIFSTHPKYMQSPRQSSRCHSAAEPSGGADYDDSVVHLRKESGRILGDNLRGGSKIVDASKVQPETIGLDAAHLEAERL